ncbi:hypothetical protein AVEN_14226-1 [Araneus ventricosus]|uniref:Uncharacterized protein n=1 Tax=Araneus ventricosus TaxID=182803 RepID=A0A4Y2GL32_ARAVE|nr:hypothetical protein AVEN_14226-1 [Araneus ventricosus]
MSTIMPKSLEIFVDHRHRINEDRKVRLSHENLAKSKDCRSRVSTICARSLRRQDSSKTRDVEAENRKQVQEKTVIVRLAQKKNNISSIEIVEDLKLNVPALTVGLRIKNTGLIICIKRPYISEQNITNMVINIGLCKIAYFEGFKNSWKEFYGQPKSNMDFSAQKRAK